MSKKALKITSISALVVASLASGLTPSAATEAAPTFSAAQLAQEMGTHGSTMGNTAQSKLPADSNAINGAAAAAAPAGGVLGMDVSSYQPSINWQTQYNRGARFSYNKVSEGTSYLNPYRNAQNTGARNVGMYAGGYHFALPSVSSGAEQARYFVNNGGGWRNDGKTLPGLLDVEYNPYRSLGNQCYNMSQTQMRTWIRDFINTYKSMTGVSPTIYTNTNWWNACVGNTTEFSSSALHIANYSSSRGALPSGWSDHTIWQYSDAGIFPGDSNQFNGNAAQLKNFAATGNKDSQVTTRTSPYALVGAIGAKYYADGSEAKYGTPLGNEFAVPGGMTQQFSKPYNIYWSESTGAHPVYWNGDIGNRYRAAGYERGWGFPITREEAIGPGAKQVFRALNGRTTVAYWSAETGTKIMNNNGAIWANWANNGGRYTYGFPATDETYVGSGGYKVSFVKNGYRSAMYWSPETGTKTINEYGGIAARWNERGGHAYYGFPSTNETAVPGGGASVYFKKGNNETAIYWSQAYGAKVMNGKGAIHNHWKSNGFTAKFGHPTTDEYTDRFGVTHVIFSNGYDIQWTPTGGTRVVKL